MPLPLSRRILLLLALAAALAPPCGAAAPHGSAAAPDRGAIALKGHPSLLGGAWEWISSLWSGSFCALTGTGCGPVAHARPVRLHPEEGCGLDPGGHRCGPGSSVPTPPQPDAGCGLDPGGHCF
jgi:hypothetical protein